MSNEQQQELNRFWYGIGRLDRLNNDFINEPALNTEEYRHYFRGYYGAGSHQAR